MRKFLHMLNSRWGIVIFLSVLIALNIIASVFHTRIDFTNERRFTLSNGTKALLKSIDDPIKIQVFLKGNYPSGFKKLASSASDILREFKEIAGNKIVYEFIAPEDLVPATNTTYGDTLAAMGLIPINLTAQRKDGQQQQNVFPFALVSYKDKAIPVEIYKGKTPIISFNEVNKAEAVLEYNFAHAIALIKKQQKSKIGYAIGNGEPMDYSVYDLAEEAIKPNYDLSLININQQPFIGPEFKAVIILKPSIAFSDYEKLKLDQYVMHGGKLLFFLDELNAEMDSLKIKNEVVAYDRELNLTDLLFKYGVRINPDLLMDLQCDYLPFDVSGNGQFEFLPWNYFPVLESPENHVINKNLGYVSGKFANSIELVQSEGIEKTVLLQSSVNSRLISSPAIISGKENVTAPEDDKFKIAHVPVAVLLEGKFHSLFSNHLTNDFADSLKQYNIDFLQKSDSAGQIIVVSDGDILQNAVIKGNQPLPMGMNQFTYGSQRQFPFANKEFLLNMLEYVTNDNGLAEAKNKDFIVRFLDTKKLNQEKAFWQGVNIIVPIIIIILFAMVFQWNRKRKYSV